MADYLDPTYMGQTGTPAGGITINDAYVQAYKAGFEQAFQQSESKLQPYFESETQNEEFQYFDRIGTAEAMSEDATRYGDNPNSSITHERRRIGLKDYELGKYVDEKDLKRVLTDPMNAYTQALLASGKRKIDDIIIDKFFGTAYVGKSGGTNRDFVAGVALENEAGILVGAKSAGDITTAGDYTLATGETEGFSVGADYGSQGSGLTLAKLRAARRTMLKLHAIDQDEIVNCFVSAKQLDDLLGITEVVSSDFAVRKSLAEGSVTTFMGFRFIHTERLPLSVGDGDERRCIIATSKALKLSTSTALKGDVWRVPAKKNIPYVYFKLAAEASRMWGEVAGEIRCNES
ncbi:major capsid protein [uncultured Mediterranean phage uvMED]|nr:major capsid protein [uncultured Mediterranean phage uvMED]BAR22522.1 major capsid protein [uncultured Mediterranean phage uvMED]